MIVPVICDLLGAHQIIGYASAPTAHYICPLCDIDKDDINVLDKHEWPLKNPVDAKTFAAFWRDSKSNKNKEKIFEAFGWRWSPLFDLPYFDPTTFTTIDPMHAIDSGLLQHHCRGVFQIDLEHVGGDGHTVVQTQNQHTRELVTREVKERQRCIRLIRKNPPNLLFKLLRKHRKILYSICCAYGIIGEGHTIVIGTRWILASNIYKWVRISLYSVEIMMAIPTIASCPCRHFCVESRWRR